MSNMSAWEYRREIRMFRGELTNTAEPAGRRTLKGEGFQWYKVKAEPTVSLYLDLSNLYLKAFRNAYGCYKFYHEGNPRSRGGTIIDATELEFLESYNGNAGRRGIGLPQDLPCTVTLTNLNMAFETMAAERFAEKNVDEQRLAIVRCVVGIVEAARFKDVEDHVVAGTEITDRSWVNHVDPSKLFIEPPA